MKKSDKALFVQMVEQFYATAQSLNEVWGKVSDLPENALSHQFPFAKSFDQIVLDIEIWNKSVKRIMEGVQCEDERLFSIDCPVGRYSVDANTGNVIKLFVWPDPSDEEMAKRNLPHYEKVVHFDLDEYLRAYSQFQNPDYLANALEGEHLDFDDFEYYVIGGERYPHNPKYRAHKNTPEGIAEWKAKHQIQAPPLKEEGLEDDGTKWNAENDDPDLAEIGMIAAFVGRNLDIELGEYKSDYGMMETFARVGQFAEYFEGKYRNVVEWETYLDRYHKDCTGWEDFVLQCASEFMIAANKAENDNAAGEIAFTKEDVISSLK